MNLFVRIETFREMAHRVHRAFRDHQRAITQLAEAVAVAVEVVDEQHHALRQAGLIDTPCVGERLAQHQQEREQFNDLIRTAFTKPSEGKHDG